MPPDLDELLARADSATAEKIPTRRELMRSLIEALDELEEQFPDGRPPGDETADALLKRSRHTLLVCRVNHARFLLEGEPGVDFVDEPTAETTMTLTLIRGGRDDG